MSTTPEKIYFMLFIESGESEQRVEDKYLNKLVYPKYLLLWKFMKCHRFLPLIPWKFSGFHGTMP